MDFKIFNKSGLVLTQHHGKFTLSQGVPQIDKVVLIPFPFAQDIKYIRVEEKFGLIFTPDKVYNLDGVALGNFPSSEAYPVEIIKYRNSYLLTAKNQNGCQVALYDGFSFVWNYEVTDVKYSKQFIALKFPKFWCVYRINGEEMVMHKLPAEYDIQLGFDLLVYGSAGNYTLLDPVSGRTLCDKQVQILCSSARKFAICISLAKRSVQVYTNDNWVSFDDVDEPLLISDKHQLFALRRNNKYFIYQFDCVPFLAGIYKDGVDFVAQDGNSLMIVNNKIANFYRI
ncbi:MAG: hypothetical protein Q4D80_00685 [Pseudomonadota bacterium]|nr:hypothetical protein [Pseudomonadota bacterium]